MNNEKNFLKLNIEELLLQHYKTWTDEELMEVEKIFMKPGQEWIREKDKEKDKDIVKIAYKYFTWKNLDELIKFAYGYMKRGVKDKERAYELSKDVVYGKLQDAFVRYLHTYDPKKYNGGKCPFRNWVFTMVARRAVSVSKRENKAEMKRLELVKKQKEKVKRITYNPFTEISWEEIEPYVAKLSPKYKEALELMQGLGLSHKEAARKSHWPCKEGAMKVRLFRARQELRKLKERELFEEQHIDQLPMYLQQAYNLIERNRKTFAEAAKIARCTEDEMKERLRKAKSIFDEAY